MAIPSTPLVSRSSTMRCCSAAVPSAVSLNSASTSASSCVGLLDAAPRDRPEVGGVVGDEGQLERLRASGRRSRATGTPPSHTRRTTSTATIRRTARAFIRPPPLWLGGSQRDRSALPNATTPGDDPANTYGRYPVCPLVRVRDPRDRGATRRVRPSTATVPPLPPPVIRAPYSPPSGPSARTSSTRRSVPGEPRPQRP